MVAPENVETARRWSKPKVRNSIGGKNPQIHTKGRGVTKPGKGITKKDIGVVKLANIKGKKVVIPFPYKSIEVNKENIPSSSHQIDLEEKKEKGREDVRVHESSVQISW